MAGGKPPPPPLSPHEEGENSNSKPFINQPHRQPHENDSEMVIISSNIPSTSNGNTTNLSVSHKPSYSEVVKGPSPNPIHTQPLRPTAYNLEVSQPLIPDVPLLPISEFQGKPSVIFPISVKKLLVDKLQFVLIGKFTHGRPTWSTILQFFQKLKLTGSYLISNFDKKHIFIECSNKFDYYRIWMKLSWFIGDYAMRVFKWTSNFSPLVEAAIAPVWVRFEGLPLYMFDVLPLLSVSNCLGKPIRVDPRNVSRTIVNSARVCVELDLSQPLVEDVWVIFEDEQTKKSIEGFWVKVFYDAVPPYCDFCSHIGHGMQSCKRRSDMVIMGDKRPEISMQFHSPDTACDQDGSAKPMCAPEVNVELVKSDQGFAGQGDADQVCAVVVGHGVRELVGKKKDFSQLEGMLANKMLQNASNPSSSWSSAYPKAQKTNQRQKKVYQAKKKLQLSSEALEITKNSFAILEEEVLIEDLSLEEGELVVADVCVPSAIPSPLVHAATVVTASEPVGEETGPGLAFARDLSIGQESKRVDAGSQKPADGKVVVVQKVPAGVSVTSGKAAAEEDNVVMVLDDTASVKAEAVQDMQFRRDDFVVQNEVLQEAEVLQDELYEQNRLQEHPKQSTGLCATADPFSLQGYLAESTLRQNSAGNFPVAIGNLAAVAINASVREYEEGQEHGLQEHTHGSVKSMKQLNGMLLNNSLKHAREDYKTDAELSSTDSWETAAALSAAVLVEGLMPSDSVQIADQVGTAGSVLEAATVGKMGLLSPEAETNLNRKCKITHKSSISPRKLSSSAAEFKPKWEVLVKELVEENKQSHPVMFDRSHKEKKASAGKIVADRVQKVIAKAQAVLAEKKAQAQGDHTTLNNNAMEQLQERMNRLRGVEVPAAQRLAASTRVPSPLLSDEMKDIICPFKCKSVPNSPPRSKKQ